MKNEFSFLFLVLVYTHSVVFLCRFGDVITIIWRRQQQKLAACLAGKLYSSGFKHLA